METLELTKDGKRFWNTKKTKIFVSETSDPVSLYGAYWSGGSRNQWYAVTKEGTFSVLPSVGPAPFDNRPTPSFKPSENEAVVCAGVFNGKPATVHVYVKNKSTWTF